MRVNSRPKVTSFLDDPLLRPRAKNGSFQLVKYEALVKFDNLRQKFINDTISEINFVTFVEEISINTDKIMVSGFRENIHLYQQSKMEYFNY